MSDNYDQLWKAVVPTTAFLKKVLTDEAINSFRGMDPATRGEVNAYVAAYAKGKGAHIQEMIDMLEALWLISANAHYGL